MLLQKYRPFDVFDDLFHALEPVKSNGHGYRIEENEENYKFRLIVPESVKEEDIKVSLKDGVLIIDMPKKTANKTRDIPIDKKS